MYHCSVCARQVNLDYTSVVVVCDGNEFFVSIEGFCSLCNSTTVFNASIRAMELFNEISP